MASTSAARHPCIQTSRIPYHTTIAFILDGQACTHTSMHTDTHAIHFHGYHNLISVHNRERNKRACMHACIHTDPHTFTKRQTNLNQAAACSKQATLEGVQKRIGAREVNQNLSPLPRALSISSKQRSPTPKHTTTTPKSS